MKKLLIIGFITGFVSTFLGNLCYDILSTPDGYLYLDPDTKSVYAALDHDPDKYKSGSRLIFVFKS